MLIAFCTVEQLKSQTEEIWRELPGSPNYRVSSHGNIMQYSSLDEIWVPHQLNSPSHGYSMVNISGRGSIAVHRLVAEAFIGPRPPRMAVNHKNFVKFDNRAQNLEYCTPAENFLHARAMVRLRIIAPDEIISMSAAGLTSLEHALHRLLAIGEFLNGREQSRLFDDFGPLSA